MPLEHQARGICQLDDIFGGKKTLLDQLRGNRSEHQRSLESLAGSRAAARVLLICRYRQDAARSRIGRSAQSYMARDRAWRRAIRRGNAPNEIEFFGSKVRNSEHKIFAF